MPISGYPIGRTANGGQNIDLSNTGHSEAMLILLLSLFYIYVHLFALNDAGRSTKMAPPPFLRYCRFSLNMDIPFSEIATASIRFAIDYLKSRIHSQDWNRNYARFCWYSLRCAPHLGFCRIALICNTKFNVNYLSESERPNLIKANLISANPCYSLVFLPP